MLNTGLTKKFSAAMRIKVFLTPKAENAGGEEFLCRANGSDNGLEIKMALKGVPLFSMLRAKMEWLSERQKLLSENIANADTPGYRARDLKPVDFEEMMKRGAGADIAVTRPGHLKGGADVNRFNFKPVEVEGQEANPTGNTVSIEDQMVKLGETQMEYETATGIYRKQAALLKLALGGRN
jgi:flagellar basal-body rod protein FlgB